MGPFLVLGEAAGSAGCARFPFPGKDNFVAPALSLPQCETE